MNNITKSILLQLPCKPGDTVYIIYNDIATGHPKIIEDTINMIYIDTPLYKFSIKKYRTGLSDV